MIKRLGFFIILFFILQSCVPLKNEKIKILYSRSDEDRRDKGVPIISSVNYEEDRFVIKGENLRGVKSVKIQGQNINYNLSVDATTQYQAEASSKGLLELLTGGLTYIFLIENTYGQTPFLVTINFPDNSISTEKIIDSSITGEKIKNNTISVSKLSSMGAQDGDYLKWSEKNKSWEPSPLNSIQFRGTWNVEEKPESPVEGNLVGQVGDFYIISKSGVSNVINEGENWYEGDWIISTGESWKRINNSGKITSIFGREGAITPKFGDYSWEQIEKKNSKLSDIGDVGEIIPADKQILQWNQDEESWLPADLKITTINLQENSIENDNIQNNAITSEKISDFSISSEKLSENSITNEKLANNSITSIKIEEGTILDEDISDFANIERSKIEKTPEQAGNIIINNEEGALSSIGILDIGRGGTGAKDPKEARENLGLKIGVDVQKYSQKLKDITNLNFREETLLGSNGSNLVLKSSSEIREILNLGKENQFFVSEDGFVGIGTSVPSERLEVNGNMNLRGNLNMNSFPINGVGEPEKDYDGVNRGWAINQLKGLQNNFYYNNKITVSTKIGMSNSFPLNGSEKNSSKNFEKFIKVSDDNLNISSIGLYKISFKATCNGLAPSQLSHIELKMKKNSQSEWETLSSSKTFGNTMIIAEGIFTVDSLDDPASIKIFNISDGERSFEFIDYTLIRIGNIN